MEKLENDVSKLYDFVVQKFKFFIDKNHFVVLKLVLAFLLSCVLSVACEYTIMRRYHPEYISKIRMILVACIFYFTSLHFIFKLDKMYEFIHKYRFVIAVCFLLFVMILKLSGSSIVSFNAFIQSHNDDRKFHTILGVPRYIRTDEWATSTTYIMSQANSTTPFSYFSNVPRATDTDMYTVANAPVVDILMLGRPFQIGFMLFGNDMGLSFYWYIRLIAMMLGSYELCLIFTKKKKFPAFVGMIMITFSSATQWWYCMDTLIWGQIAVVLFDKFMNVKNKLKKYLCAFGMLVSILSYIFVFYPSWQLPFGYVFLAIVIWIAIKNIKYGDYKINKHDVIVAIITCVCLVLLIGRWYGLSKDTLAMEMNTDYPGERQETGGFAQNIYSYFYDIFFPFFEYLNPCEFAAMLSFFPIPIFLGIIYIVRNKKDLHFWIPMLIVSIMLSIWCIWGFPASIANITKFSMAQSGRATIPLGTICIYLLVFLFGNFDKEKDKLLNLHVSAVLAVIFTTYIAYKAKNTIAYREDFLYLDKFKMLVAFEFFVAAIFCILNLNNNKLRKAGYALLITIALLSGLRVNPVISTTNIFYEKPVAKKMKEIKDQNPNSIWVVDDDGWYCNDYALASGIRTINSTALYPNFDMYKKVLGDERAEELRTIYNRYGHINFIITDKESDVKLVFFDNVEFDVNYKDLKKLDIEYIISFEDLCERDYGDAFLKLYDEDGIYIFQYLNK